MSSKNLQPKRFRPIYIWYLGAADTIISLSNSLDHSQTADMFSNTLFQYHFSLDWILWQSSYAGRWSRLNATWNTPHIVSALYTGIRFVYSCCGKGIAAECLFGITGVPKVSSLQFIKLINQLESYLNTNSSLYNSIPAGIWSKAVKSLEKNVMEWLRNSTAQQHHRIF